MSRNPKTLAVVDFETDPFAIIDGKGRVPRPFAVRFHSEAVQWEHWGDDCADRLVEFLGTLSRPHVIFAHNGGKFDFHFLVDYLENPIKIIASRIVSAKIGKHTFRDSYALMPVPLRDFKKDKTDYDTFERPNREKHKKAILEYLYTDCLYLFQLVSAFVDRFGLRLTAAGTAMREVAKMYDFAKMDANSDALFRSYYYGGRVQCFEAGILPGPWQVYDVNSMYPHAMRNFEHPVNNQWDEVSRLPERGVYFAEIDATSRGALPVRTKEGIVFPHARGVFKACSHEIREAQALGLLDVHGVHMCHVALETITFERYVDQFYQEKVAAKKNGDKANEIFAKLLLNSAYGKFATNPDHFRDYWLCRDFYEALAECEVGGYEIEFAAENHWILSRPSEDKERGLYDVSIGASITSASRAVLLRGLSQSERPIYCDTDSIICKSFGGEIDENTLGAWKHEKTADIAAIAGKKLYALYNKNAKEPEKIAAKGGSLDMRSIIEICNGAEIESASAAPTFRLNRPPTFIKRKFKKTA